MPGEGFATRRHQRAIERLDRRIDKKRAKLEMWRQKKLAKEITPGKFANKKALLDNEIRELSARRRTRQGQLKKAHYG